VPLKGIVVTAGQRGGNSFCSPLDRTVHVARRAVQFCALWTDTKKRFIIFTNMAALAAYVSTIDVAHH
jgi:hypothetical protein